MLPIVSSAPDAAVEEPAKEGIQSIVQPSREKQDRRKQRQTSWREIRLCSVRGEGESTALFGAVLGTAFEAGCVWEQTARQSGYGEQTRMHGVGDGAPWIADQFEKQFGTHGRYHIDFYHVCEYLSKASHTCRRAGQTPGQWFKTQKQ